MKFAVVIYNTYDLECPVYLFDTYDKAKEYLLDVWQWYYNEELANSFVGIDEEKTFYEEDHARITWNDGEYMEYNLTTSSEPMKINGKDYR